MRRLSIALAIGAVSAALSLASAACAPTYAPGYQDALGRGLAAKHAGRYGEAAKAFDEAADLGERYKDRDEARLLQAQAFELAGKWIEAEAAYARVAKESGGRYQGVRAEFDAARVEQEHGDREKGDLMMVDAVKRNPSSGYARHAVRRMAGPIETEKGPDAALEFLRSFEAGAVGTDLDEEIAYEEGLVLFRAGRLAEARDAFVKQARAHPYPLGALTDDAYYQAARIEEHLGNFDAALVLLAEMIHPSEAAYAGSSYERPRFPQAQYLIAHIHLVDLHDRARGKVELRRMFDEHRPSRLTDDALWLEAQLEKQDGDNAAACDSVAKLAEATPHSRYVRCARELCPSAPAGDKPCAEYVLRELRGESVPEDPIPFGPAPLAQEPRPVEGQ